MLRLRAFRPTTDKVVNIQLHPTHPWLVTADANDRVSVWDWEHRQLKDGEDTVSEEPQCVSTCGGALVEEDLSNHLQQLQNNRVPIDPPLVLSYHLHRASVFGADTSTSSTPSQP